MTIASYDSRLLTCREEYLEFSKKISGKKGKEKVDLDWLSQQQVYGIFINGELQGGVVHESPPLYRTLHDIPKEEREPLLIKHCRSPERAIGLTCFWFSKPQNANYIFRCTLASLLASLILKRKLRYIIFSTSHDKLNAICEKMHLEQIFSKRTNIKTSQVVSSTYLIKRNWFNFFRFMKFILVKPSWV